jgi:hypothetical protein
MKNEESNIQKAVIKWINLKYPNLLYCATVGGVRTSFKQAILMKQTGYRKGVPDLLIFEPLNNYHGLAVEIKTLKGRPSKHQKKWIEDLNKRKYYAKITRGFDETIKTIENYFNNTITDES